MYDWQTKGSSIMMNWSEISQNHFWQETVLTEILKVLAHHQRHWQSQSGTLELGKVERIAFSLRTRSVTRKTRQTKFQLMTNKWDVFRWWGAPRLMWFWSVKLEVWSLMRHILRSLVGHYAWLMLKIFLSLAWLGQEGSIQQIAGPRGHDPSSKFSGPKRRGKSHAIIGECLATMLFECCVDQVTSVGDANKMAHQRQGQQLNFSYCVWAFHFGLTELSWQLIIHEECSRTCFARCECENLPHCAVDGFEGTAWWEGWCGRGHQKEAHEHWWLQYIDILRVWEFQRGAYRQLGWFLCVCDIR